MKSRLTHSIDPLAYLLNFIVCTIRSPPVALSKTDMREGSPFVTTVRPPHHLLQ